MQHVAGPVTLTREELYQQVWTTPMRRLAPTYGLSDVGLRKICAKHGIPTPPVGYWAKLEHGKRVRKTPLPQVDLESLRLVHLVHDPHPEPRQPRAASFPVADPDLVELVKHERDPENHIPAPDEDARITHPLVKKTRDATRSEARPDMYGLVRPNYQVVHECVDVTVSRPSLPRAFRLLEALFRALEKRGHLVVATQPKPGSSGRENRVRCKVLGEEFGIVLREKTRMVRLSETERKSVFDNQIRYEPKGELELRITGEFGYAITTWVDRPRKPLEDRLNSVIEGMIVAVERLRIRREERRRAELARQQREQERREQERLRQLERARIEQFEDLAGRWQKAKILRGFADAVRANRPDRSGEDDGVDRWLEWAYRHADSIDPLSAGDIPTLQVRDHSRDDDRPPAEVRIPRPCHGDHPGSPHEADS